MVRISGDFFDDRDRVGNRNTWFNFRKALWRSIRKYMDGRIIVIGSNVSREMAGEVAKGREQFGNGMGNQMGSLNDVQLGLSPVRKIRRKQ